MSTLAALVEKDVRAGLGEGFDIGGDDVHVLVAVDIDGAERGAIAWEAVAVHTREFAGLEPTGATLKVTGMTIVEDVGSGETGAKFWRVIDWAGVYSQLGVMLNGRSLVPEINR